MYRDVRVPRVQDAYERPSAALILGLTVGAKKFKGSSTRKQIVQPSDHRTANGTIHQPVERTND